MKIELKEIDKERGIARITTTDERWYIINDKLTNDKKYLPSVTWIAGHYPKGVQFYKWLANNGWDEAEAIKSAAGDKGSKVHAAIESLLSGNVIKFDERLANKETGELEDISTSEYECLLSFADWFNKTKPKVLKTETTVVSEEFGFAGTVDLVCEIDGLIYIIDFKTGQNIWTEYELQLSAYRRAFAEQSGIKPDRLAILQVGYARNKNKYKFTEIPDKFDLFLHARAIWENESEKQQPKQKDYPLEIKLNN